MTCSLRTDGHTHRQTHRVTTEDTLSGFQDFFLQPIIKDRPKNRHKKCKNANFEYQSSLFFTAACLRWKMANVKSDIYIHTLRLNTVDQLITRTHIHWLNTLAQSLLARSLHAPLPTASGSHPTCSEAGVRKKTLSFHLKKLPKNCTFNTRTTIKWLQRKSTLYHK